jgi:transcriptional regulator of acetoin/glycerol metabolism
MEQPSDTSAVYLYVPQNTQRAEVSRCLAAAGFAVQPFDSREALLDALRGGAQVAVAAGSAAPPPLAEVERQAIVAAMARFGNNRSLVAQHLGIGRTTLYRKLKSYAATF